MMTTAAMPKGKDESNATIALLVAPPADHKDDNTCPEPHTFTQYSCLSNMNSQQKGSLRDIT